MAASAQRIPAADEGDLGGAGALLHREVAVDELAVVDGGHARIVGGGRDTSSVASRTASCSVAELTAKET